MSVTLVDNVARPLATALSLAFSADAYGKLDGYGILGAAADPDAVIEALFAASEVGAWYDPSDLTTMFQDRFGRWPVTTDGQTVGVILDKSNGLALSAELVTDPSFNSPAAWTPQDANWTVSGGKATYTNNGLSYLQSVGDVSFVQDTWYKIDLTLSGVSGVSAQVTLGLFNKTASVNLLGAYITFWTDDPSPSNGTHTVYFKSPATTMGIRIYGNPSGTSPSWSLENFNIVSVAGNHAVALNDSARPLYKVTGLAKWSDFDAVDDVLNTTFPSSLGASCTVARANVGGAPTILTGQTIGTSYANSTDNAGLVITNDALTPQETADLTAWLTAKGATS